jgi:prepilin-type N-terminal cleavage/methylation domain-containing protein
VQKTIIYKEEFFMKNRKGFTLVELIVVVAVLALLAVGAVLAIRGVQRNARMSANRAAAVTMSQAFNQYNAAVSSTEAVVSIPAGAAWTRVLPPLLPGGDSLEFSVALSSSARFAQVGGWISLRDGTWIVRDDASFDVPAL